MVIKDRISKEEVNEMPKVVFEGQMFVVDTPEQADFAVRYLSQFDLLGIDSETRPAFKRGEIHKVALLQIATYERCYMFRLNKFGMTLPLINLLENPHIVKVGLSLKDDFMMLHQRADFEPRGVIELQTYVTQFGIKDLSLQKIYANLFGQKISKAQRLSNWEADELTIPQQQYASIDAWACIQIYRKLEELRKSGDYEIQIVEEPIDEPTQ
ncbi:MAG: 3'-5' exonuclease domain-containing protein 2 [Bacteroidaceae bacterium]|nr:3'-5' exonuclease domain-containing protein 2 [Bacteroidaceae bacterium]